MTWQGVSRCFRSAVDTLRARGYKATSVEDLVDSTGLSRSSLYDTFGSKRELFEQAVTLYADERGTYMFGELEVRDASLGTIIDFFANFNALAKNGPEHLTMGWLVTNTLPGIGTSDNEVRELTIAYVERLTGAFSNALTNSDVDGTIGESLVRERAPLRATVALGVFVRVRGGIEVSDAEALAASVRSLVTCWKTP